MLTFVQWIEILIRKDVRRDRRMREGGRRLAIQHHASLPHVWTRCCRPALNGSSARILCLHSA